LKDAIIYYLATENEIALRRISPEFRADYPQIPWKGIVGMRSKVVHDYLNIDEDIVWQTIKHDLTPLVLELETIFKSK
jgi:uncharacterized protein with HEPN domain